MTWCLRAYVAMILVSHCIQQISHEEEIHRHLFMYSKESDCSNSWHLLKAVIDRVIQIAKPYPKLRTISHESPDRDNRRAQEVAWVLLNLCLASSEPNRIIEVEKCCNKQSDWDKIYIKCSSSHGKKFEPGFTFDVKLPKQQYIRVDEANQKYPNCQEKRHS